MNEVTILVHVLCVCLFLLGYFLGRLRTYKQSKQEQRWQKWVGTCLETSNDNLDRLFELVVGLSAKKPNEDSADWWKKGTSDGNEEDYGL